jgi:hypothetical protein
MTGRLTVASALFALVACGRGGDGAQPTTTSTTAAVAASTTTTVARVVDYSKLSPATEVGAGLVEGASPDGSALYVTALDPVLSKPGCEGQPEPVLFRVPVGGGPRQPVGTPGDPVRGTIARGSGGRIALVAGCEEFLSRVRVGTETPDGQLRDLRPLDLGQLTSSVTWSGDGRSLLAVSRSGAQTSVVRVDPGTGTSTPVFTVSGPVTQVGQLADGTFVVAGLGKVTLRDATGAAKETVDGVGFAVAPDGRSLALWGKTLAVLTPGQPATTLATAAATELLGPAQFSPDGRAVGYVTSVKENASVAVATVADKKVTTVPGPGRLVRVSFTGDGRGLAFSRLAARPADEATVLLVRFEG